MNQQSSHTFFIAPTAVGSGLTSVSIGLVRALDRIGLRVAFCKPIGQPHDADVGPDRSTEFIRRTTNLHPPEPIDIGYAETLISEGEQDQLMEEVVAKYSEIADGADVIIVEGLVPTSGHSYADQINGKLAETLDAEVILVTGLGYRTIEEMDNEIEIAAQLFGGLGDPQMMGCIVNKINVPDETGVEITAERQRNVERAALPADQEPIIRKNSRVFQRDDFRLIGVIPWKQELIAPRARDIADHMEAEIITRGLLEQRRVRQIAICARHVPNMLNALRPGTLIVTPGDRHDIVVATALASHNGVPIAGLVLTGGIAPDERIMKFCRRAFDEGLPVMMVDSDTYQNARILSRLNTEVPLDDIPRIELVMDTVARGLDTEWLRNYCLRDREPRMSPPAFRYQLVRRAREASKRIVLPEGDEPRTIQAATICHERNIAKCILVAKPESVRRVAEAVGVTLPDDLEIIDPDPIRHQYVEPMVELRKHKGLTAPLAEQQLEDNVVLATMMLAQGEVDGLVSGAVHTTANTVRPALQLIKTSPDARLVSSVFFMLLPEQVLVYGDCAINPDPDAQELADIAIQSAESAAAFGINPRVAMISYSTGSSGEGSDVEKVREATRLAREMRGDLPIDGPLQYDAAAIAEVAAKKAPGSPVAGKATVFVFPDLNTGNTTYKAVQRSANVVSIGPMLQGLRKPVNDLSRGALIDDIVYTIAITAIQAVQAEQKAEKVVENVLA
jgi:phosphate acetyltransferase